MILPKLIYKILKKLTKNSKRVKNIMIKVYNNHLFNRKIINHLEKDH